MHLAKARIRRPSRARDNGCFGPLVTGGLRHPAIFRRPCRDWSGCPTHSERPPIMQRLNPSENRGWSW
jgi:hypothetical protein